jgi:hypothetical protein
VVAGGVSLSILFVEENSSEKGKNAQKNCPKFSSFFDFFGSHISNFFGLKNHKKIDPLSLLGKFMEIASKAKTVVCCRVTPLQKV